MTAQRPPLWLPCSQQDGALSSHVHKILELLEELQRCRLPDTMTASQREGFYKEKHGVFHGEGHHPSVTPYTGHGNWRLSLAAYLLAPDLRSKFNNAKKLGDFVEAFIVANVTKDPPPLWHPPFRRYIELVAQLPTLCGDAAYSALDWRTTPERLVHWAVEFDIRPRGSLQPSFRPSKPS